MIRFHQAEGFTGRLIVQDCHSFAELDEVACRASDILSEDQMTNCYYKCDLIRDGKVIDRFDLKPLIGRGVDDLGRTPSEMLKQHGIEV